MLTSIKLPNNDHYGPLEEVKYFQALSLSWSDKECERDDVQRESRPRWQGGQIKKSMNMKREHKRWTLSLCTEYKNEKN